MGEIERPTLSQVEQTQIMFYGLTVDCKALWDERKNLQRQQNDPQAEKHDFEAFTFYRDEYTTRLSQQYLHLVGKDSANYVSPAEKELVKREPLTVNIRQLAGGNDPSFFIAIPDPAISFFMILKKDRGIIAAVGSPEAGEAHAAVLRAFIDRAKESKKLSLSDAPLPQGVLIGEDVFVGKLSTRNESSKVLPTDRIVDIEPDL
jgi:hypothetical protein